MSRPQGIRELLLISGGPDSVFLFHRYLELKEKRAVDFAVLHVNHGLRGAESEGDEAFVRDLCALHGVKCFARRLEPETFRSGNLQDFARRERLRICFELQRDFGFAVAVTAHHADDVLETLIMRGARGSGLSGLCGIRRRSSVRNPLLPGARLNLFRPLLNRTKVEILELLKAEGIGFRTDSSNLTDKYFRNRVRKNLTRGSESPRHSLLALSRALQSADDYFRARVAFLLNRYRHFVPMAEWNSWPEEIRFRFFAKKMRRNGYRKQIGRKHFAAVSLDNAKSVLGGAHFFKDASGCYFYSGESLSRFKRKHPGLRPGSYLFGPMEERISVGPSSTNSLMTLEFAGEFGTLPLKSAFLDVGKRRLSLKDWCHDNGVPFWRRRFLPVLRESGGEQGKAVISLPK